MRRAAKVKSIIIINDAIARNYIAIGRKCQPYAKLVVGNDIQINIVAVGRTT